MTNKSDLTVERLFDASISEVWQAITQKELMKQWYFDLAEFKAEIGFKFEFTGGPPEKEYLHLCEVTEVIPEKKLTYTKTSHKTFSTHLYATQFTAGN